MNKLLIIACFICCSALVKGQRNIDVLHYRYEIELNDRNDTIIGLASVSFTSKVELTTFYLDLIITEKTGKGMAVSRVEFNDPNLSTPKFKQEAGKLKITATTPINKGETISVFIYYKGIPADGLIISKNKYGNRTFFSDNWPNRAHNWIPCVDDPADKATVEFIITAPSHYQVISNGVQIEETNLPDSKKLTHWKEDVPLPTKVMVIGVADFAVNNIGDVNCVPVSSWVYPENKKEGFGDYAPAKEILNWYIKYIGAYAYKKLANVQSKTTFGGMENASAIFYYENSVTGKQQEDALIAHELVHQWFGNHVTEKSFAHLWLSEGFATYLTHIYLESKYGTDSLNKRMQKDKREVIEFVKTEKKPVVDSTKDYMSLLNANSYQKGGWVLHMLRRELGDSVFKKAVRKYYEMYAGKNADTKDLQKIFETVSGKNLEQFFRQWLYTGENPKLEISWKYAEKGQQLSITVKQLQKMAFNFPLQVAIGISGGASKPQIKDLRITKQVETFNIPVGRKGFLFQTGIDPFVSLLCEYTLNEVK
jgi:aminopeptidase N